MRSMHYFIESSEHPGEIVSITIIVLRETEAFKEVTGRKLGLHQATPQSRGQILYLRTVLIVQTST